MPQPDPHHSGSAARRDLQPGGPEPRDGVLRDSGVHRNADALGALRLLEAIRILGLKEKTRFYQASTSELYGRCRKSRRPRRPLSIRAHLTAWQALRLLDHRELREAYGFFACNGICSTTNRPSAGRPSSRARSRARWRGSRRACSRNSTSATWTRA